MTTKQSPRYLRFALMRPSILLFGSMLLGYFVFFLPWSSLIVRPIIKTPSPDLTDNTAISFAVGQSTQIVARFWESQPMLFTGEVTQNFNPTCKIGKVDWQNATSKQSYDRLHLIGLVTVFLEFSTWITILVMHPKLKSVVPRLVLVSIVACVGGIIVLALLGPSASCPQFSGVIVEHVSPIWLTALVSIASIVLGVVGIFTSKHVKESKF